eukprot:4903916-Heterocapsa_arctica.AAC.1
MTWRWHGSMPRASPGEISKNLQSNISTPSTPKQPCLVYAPPRVESGSQYGPWSQRRKGTS